MPAPQPKALPRTRKERPENADKRRAQVIAAACRSIVKNGLSGTTLATMAKEAGLSQGVALFYFQNKQTLLAEVLRHQYEQYQLFYENALVASGPRPVDQLKALIRADFAPEVCNNNTLVIWHAFWGEASSRPHYASISETFEAKHHEAMRGVIFDLLSELGRQTVEAETFATGIDALTDGLWLKIYRSIGETSLETGLRITLQFVAASFPEIAEDILDEQAQS